MCRLIARQQDYKKQGDSAVQNFPMQFIGQNKGRTARDHQVRSS